MRGLLSQLKKKINKSGMLYRAHHLPFSPAGKWETKARCNTDPSHGFSPSPRWQIPSFQQAAAAGSSQQPSRSQQPSHNQAGSGTASWKNTELEEPHLTLGEFETERFRFTAPAAFCFPTLQAELVDSPERHSLLKKIIIYF